MNDSPDQPDPYMGRFLAGRYLVQELIARGGVGAVYRATHAVLGEDLAIKFLAAESATWVQRERFRREAKTLSRLRHPNIVSVLDLGEEDGDLFLVMELVPGLTFADAIERRMLTPTQNMDVFGGILRALESAHDQGIVHRDVKPSNVMLTQHPDGMGVKLLDFGLADVGDPQSLRLTASGAIQGTPLYMSPEQCRGEEAGPKSDVYSLGVTMFEALTGVPPFVAEEQASLMAQHLYGAPPSFASVGSTADPAVEAVVRACLAKRPTDRPSAHELRRRLENVGRGTDEHSLAEKAASERKSANSAGRPAPTVPTSAATVDDSAAPGTLVAIWLSQRERARALHVILAVNGLRPRVAEVESELDVATGAVVLSGADDLAERVATARTRVPRVPILVVDVTGEPAELVRLGVNDFALAGAEDAGLAKKVSRLIRRRR